MRLLLALLVVATLAACGPVQSTAALVDADVAVEAARAAGAKNSAVYEFTGAEAYLHQAREKSGYAQYEAAISYARRATALATAAREKALAASNRSAPRDERPQETAP